MGDVLRSLRAHLPRGGSLPDEVWERRHRGITLFAWLHVPVCLLVVVFHHGVHLLAVAGCAYVALLAFAAGRGSRAWRSTAATGSLLVSVAMLIHLFDGLIELHFHFFVVVAVVAMYQSWTPYLVGIAFVLAHHGIMGTTMPRAVYNHPLAIAHPVLFASIHAAFVLAESIACLAYWSVTERAFDAEREARLRAERAGEQLARANAQVADLLAMMSHDLRTPVTVVTGYGATLLEEWDELDDETRRRFVGKMGSAGHGLEQMLTETLTLAAMDAAALPSRPEPVRVDDVARDVLDAAVVDRAPAIAAGDLQPVTAYVDRGQLRQVLGNLVTNAVKYGVAPLAVSSCERDGLAEVRVTDSGPGVPAAFVPHLFERWSRAEEARLGSQKGTGLGLYIVRELVRANGGEVRHEEAPGGGSSFVVTLPLADREPVPAAPVVPAAPAGG